jgi:hypothetical protein
MTNSSHAAAPLPFDWRQQVEAFIRAEYAGTGISDQTVNDTIDDMNLAEIGSILANPDMR